MPASVRRKAFNLALILAGLAGLAVTGHAQTTQTLHVEFNIFSGRPRPKANIADSLEARKILDSLEVRIAAPVPCSEIPAMPSTPNYTATLLRFAVPVAQRNVLVVGNGYIYYDTALPCYRDPGSNLEKLAIATAFGYPDLNAPGGPRPMAYLSCMIPDSLYAHSEPCATGLEPLRRDAGPVRKGVRPAFGFGLDGRFRPPESPVLLLDRPAR